VVIRVIGMLILLGAGAAAADPEKASEPAPAPEQAAEPAPPVAYDALFRLPSDTGAAARPAPTESGAQDRKRWEERFAAVRGDLDDAREELAKSQAQLEAMARKTENWQMAAPGAQPTAENSPVSYKLRQDIRRQREEVGRAERRLRELEVEASLAGVPPEWRVAPVHEDAAPSGEAAN
jgi:hypothetical protein